MTSPAPPRGNLRVAAASLNYGGLSGIGEDSARCRSMAHLLDRAPDVVLVQAMNGRAPYRLGPDGHLEPDYHVHHVLASAGLAHAAFPPPLVIHDDENWPEPQSPHGR